MRRRAGRYLSCFYCGKRSTIRFDGITTEFDCPNCDATNYLDENGEITDPPVAMVQESHPGVQHTTARQTSPRTENIFCSTCLKNQHLFTASLAQYLPEDSDDPDNEELERDYYKFRRGLEKRYPQVCEQCEVRVNSAIDKAGYTAKTDHLRKMMDLSRQSRLRTNRTSKLDWVYYIGRLIWWGGFLLQMSWHLKGFLEIIISQKDSESGMSDPEDEGRWQSLIGRVLSMLPPKHALLRFSLWAGLFVVWWNPQFVKVVRGFTRHLLGLRQWYCFQLLIVAFRLGVINLVDLDGQPKNAQLSAHLVMAAAMSLLYTLALRAIKVDTTPLFGGRAPVSPPRPDAPLVQQRSSEPKGFAEMLNEALDSPNTTPTRKPNIQSAQVTPAPMQSQSPFLSSSRFRSAASQQFGTPNTQAYDASDEMDWTPTVESSPPRALQGSRTPAVRGFGQGPTSSLRTFGQAPTNTDSGAFWYKVPPAPLNPAHKLRNPPNQPALIAKPKETGENIFFRGAAAKRGDKLKGGSRDGGVTFNQPKFFAPGKENDETNSLADMLGQSFSLGSGETELDPGEGTQSEKLAALRSETQRQQRTAVEIIVVGGIVVVWLLMLTMPVAHVCEIQLGLLGLASAVGIYACRARAAAGLVVAGTELAGLGYAGWGAWRGDATEAGCAGIGVLFVMLGHLVWDMFS
ncbi:hypothetical protein V2G26_001511 [Clonostachys chloroleuca]